MTENPDHDAAASRRLDETGDGWQQDHVVVESWFDGRWRRFDSEVESLRPTLPQPMDIGHRAVQSTGFVTAAQARAGYRPAKIDPYTYGVDPFVPTLRGPRLLFDEVIHGEAHRFGDELLLDRYRADADLHPGGTVLQESPAVTRRWRWSSSPIRPS